MGPGGAGAGCGPVASRGRISASARGSRPCRPDSGERTPQRRAPACPVAKTSSASNPRRRDAASNPNVKSQRQTPTSNPTINRQRQTRRAPPGRRSRHRPRPRPRRPPRHPTPNAAPEQRPTPATPRLQAPLEPPRPIPIILLALDDYECQQSSDTPRKPPAGEVVSQYSLRGKMPRSLSAQRIKEMK